MSYYCQITAVTRTRPSSYTVEYELRDDTPNPDIVIDIGSISLVFEPRLLDGTIPVGERRRFVIDQPEQSFRAIIDQVRAGDAAFTAIENALVGRRYPAT